MSERKSRSGWRIGCGTIFTTGGIVAGVLSYLTDHHFFWALFHALLGWWYVLYRVLFHWSEVLALFR